MPMIDSEILASFRELEEDDNPSFVKEYFTQLMRVFPEKLPAIREDIAQKNFRKLATDAHAVKSACMNAGITAIADPCRKLEELGQSASVEGAIALLDGVVTLVEELRAEILALPEFKQAG